MEKQKQRIVIVRYMGQLREIFSSSDLSLTIEFIDRNPDDRNSEEEVRYGEICNSHEFKLNFFELS